jgi:hypothetical protein
MKTQTFSPITVNMQLKGAVDGVLNNYDKAVVQLRQTVVTTTDYAPREGNSRSSAIAGLSAKSGGASYTNESTRTTLFAIEQGVTAQQVQEALNNMPEARLYQVISTEPILTDGQQYQVDKGNLALDTIAERQVVRDKDGNVVIREGAFVYRECFFADHAREDEDESALAEVYTPASLAHLLTPSVGVFASTADENAAEAQREADVAETADVL